MQLNKYLASCGIASRRKSSDLIKKGHIKVNTIIIKNPAYQLNKGETVLYNNYPIKPKQKIYIVLNKPKGCITTCSDEHDRKTVIDLIKTTERIFPVGRLDFNTTGILLLTNDGELAQKLAHPRFNISKTYKVSLNKTLEEKHAIKIKSGIKLEDGFIYIDHLSYQENHATITIHSGKNHIIKRIFQKFGYKIKRLDRISFAGISKKGISTGQWRYLTPKETTILKKLT